MYRKAIVTLIALAALVLVLMHHQPPTVDVVTSAPSDVAEATTVPPTSSSSTSTEAPTTTTALPVETVVPTVQKPTTTKAPAPQPRPTAVPTTVAQRPPSSPVAAPDSSVASFLACVRHHESDSAGGYSAVNPVSGAGGAYQYLPSTWANMGYTKYASRAELAAPSQQDAAAADTIARIGKSPWNGTGCS